ncbi:sulfotransferase family protein [Sphingobium yanoikuyae]|nr:hypothetical protein [Sphingobium yanoikuyae]
MADRICILVLGMHRSGTSALARVLGLLGCQAAEHLLEANEGNIRGFWESRPIMELNNRILKSAGSEWFDCQRFNDNWYKSVIVGKFKKEAKSIIDKEFGEADLFVIKDPRISLIFPFWREVLQEMGVDVAPVLTLRHPLEVAASLSHRDQFQISHVLLLWLRYTLEAERCTREVARAFTSYEGLLEAPGDFIRQSQEMLGVSWPSNSPRILAEIEEFLSPALRNHVQASTRQMRLPVAQDWIRTTFEIFSRWARQDVHEEDFQILDKIYADFDTGLIDFGRLVDDNSQLSLLSRQLSGEIDLLKQSLETANGAESAKLIMELKEKVRQLEGQRIALETKNAALEKGVVKLQRELGERQAGELREARRS